MSFTTIIATVASFALFFGAVFTSTNNPIIFVSGSSFVIVFGGTLAATFISYEPRYVLLSLKLIWRIMFSAKVGREILKSEVGRVIRLGLYGPEERNSGTGIGGQEGSPR